MLLLLALWALAAGAAEPVTLVFPSGGELRGVLLDAADGVYVLERDGGLLEFPAESVSEVRREGNAESAFRAREALLPAGDAAALWELARFAAESGLPARARRAAERVVALDPDHAPARALLGHERVFGQWLAGNALARAKGWVRHEGAWMTPAERKAYLERDAREREESLLRPAPRRDALAAALERLAARLERRPPEGITRVVLMDGGASARALARKARRELGLPDEDERNAPLPWRLEPFRARF